MPDLAVKVISPSDRYTEVEEMVSLWLEAGCRLVIVVNPRRQTVTLHRSRSEILLLTEGEAMDGADVVPGWPLSITALFSIRPQPAT